MAQIFPATNKSHGTEKKVRIVGRGLLAPLIYEDPPVEPTPFLPGTRIYPHTPQNPLLFLLLCFFYWMDNYTTADVLFQLIKLWIYTFIVPWHHKELAVYFMQQGISFLWSNAWHSFLWYSDLILYWQRHTA